MTIQPQSPTQPNIAKTIYADNAIDRAFIWLFARKMSQAVGQKTDRSGYDGFVDLSHRIMRGRNAQEQQQVVGVVLRSLMPSPVLYLIRTDPLARQKASSQTKHSVHTRVGSAKPAYESDTAPGTALTIAAPPQRPSAALEHCDRA